MIRTSAASLATVLLFTACATASRPDVETVPQQAPMQPAQPAAAPATATMGTFDPVGSYTFSVNTQGNTIGGTMNVRRGQDGRLGGEMASDQGSLTFTTVNVDGRRMTAAGVLNNGPELVFVFNFAGDDFTGSLSAQGQEIGSISGSRKKS